jgi:hypothetical protein
MKRQEIVHAVIWKSHGRVPPGYEDETEEDFVNSREWQRYVAKHRPIGMFFTIIVEARQSVMLETKSCPGLGEVDVIVRAPVELFFGEVARQDVYRDLKLRAYMWAAERFGWPPAPKLPSLTAKRTYRKNYRPPGD